ncbi:TonB-dependent receptor plug domain-containing protein [Paracidovorax sp. MALMAid1276]|uniref:TonB-dependent receptor plug domain-containing protein n=1 Tax=Paracidovorax sp. MALMAid1276 TaxID=3411631 RepID=UPI003B9A744A
MPVWLLPLLAVFSAQAQQNQAAQGSAEAPVAATLKPVVVTATRNERAIDDAPVRTEVVTREEIERTHARTLKQALENVPGLQLREVLGKSGYELSLQGLSADQVLVLIDGLPITASTSSTVDLSQYLLADVERIEVIKGASSAQYGSSAMGGVVNVITRRMPEGFRGTATVDAGSYGRQNDSGKNASANNRHARFDLSGGSEQWRLGLSGDVVDDAGFGTDPSRYPRQGDASRRQQLAARGEWRPGAQGRVWGEASRYTEDDIQRYNLFVPPANVPQRKREAITRDRVTGGADWRLANGVRAQINGVSERYDSRSGGYSNETLATDRNSRQQMQHVGTQFELPAWGRQMWMVGTDWHRETLAQTSNGLNELGVSGNAERTSAEVFVQNDILLSDTWEVLLGLRGQNDSDFGSHWAPKVSVRAHLLDAGGWKGTLRASLGQGYRVPNLKERHYLFDHSALGYRVIGNPHLQPESSTSLQLGGTLARGDGLALEVNTFHNRVRDLIQTDLANASVVDGIANYTYANVARARTSGVESSVRWQATPALALNAAYTYTRTREETTGLELTRRPRDIVRLGADWRVHSSTTLSLRLRHQSSELADTTTRARGPAWSTLDLALNYRLSHATTLFAGVNNLTNTQRDFGNPADFGPIAGRFVYLGAKVAFGNTH